MSALVFVTAVVIAVVAAVRGLWSPCGLSIMTMINPVSETGRGHRYPVTASWFVTGAVIGGVAYGALAAAGALVVSALGFTGSVAIPVVAAAACLLTAVSDDPRLGRQLPVHRRQVDEEWLGRYRSWVYALGFGAQIGSGFATYIMTSGVYLAPVLGALTGSAPAGLLVGIVFGLVRGGLVGITRRARTSERLVMLHRAVDHRASWSAAVSLLIQWSAAGTLAGGAVGPGWAVPGAVIGTAVGFVITRRSYLPPTRPDQPSMAQHRVGPLTASDR